MDENQLRLDAAQDILKKDRKDFQSQITEYQNTCNLHEDCIRDLTGRQRDAEVKIGALQTQVDQIPLHLQQIDELRGQKSNAETEKVRLQEKLQSHQEQSTKMETAAKYAENKIEELSSSGHGMQLEIAALKLRDTLCRTLEDKVRLLTEEIQTQLIDKAKGEAKRVTEWDSMQRTVKEAKSEMNTTIIK